MPNAITTITIDATGQTLGRMASQVAFKLRGKHLVSFRQNVIPPVKIVITNADKLRFTGSKLTTKTYKRFSGYPGGLKVTTLKQEFEKDPVRLVRRAVLHMLPKNRLQSRFMRNLVVTRAPQN